MYFAYVDETGDSGYEGSPTSLFGLATLLVPPEHWLAILDEAVDLRRLIRKQYGVRARTEIKGAWLLHGRGPFSGMPIKKRLNLYKMLMRQQATWGERYGARVFGVCIVKPRVQTPEKVDPRERAWLYTLQRLATEGRKNDHLTVLFPDDGHGDFIRRMVRKERRFARVPSAFQKGQQLKRDAVSILEDPNHRDSASSLFVQLADLNAYAMLRYGQPHARMGREMWELLGPALHLEVNKLRGGPPGIVAWPAKGP